MAHGVGAVTTEILTSALTSQDETSIKKALLQMRNVKDMKPDVTHVLIPQCLTFMNHRNNDIKAGAMVVIKQQMCLNNHGIDTYIPQFVQNLSAVYDYACAGDEHEPSRELLRHLICRCVIQLHLNHSESLLPHLRTTLQFMVACTGDESSTVTMSACEFWRVLSLHPVPNDLQAEWCNALQPYRTSLLHRLAVLTRSAEFKFYPAELTEFLETFQS